MLCVTSADRQIKRLAVNSLHIAVAVAGQMCIRNGLLLLLIISWSV